MTSLQGVPDACVFLADVERKYRALMAAVPGRESDRGGLESSLGGALLYAGEMDYAGRALVVASNVAGAAALTATADPAAQKQAVHDGVVDFLVTSLDEALRILKNEIRKRETVAVCVAAAPDTLECELKERGVAPDLSRQTMEEDRIAHQAQSVWVNWSVAAMPAQWLPRLDVMAMECLPIEANLARRWLRLAPRYLGRMALGERLVTAEAAFAACFSERVCQAVGRRELAVPVTMRICDEAGCRERQFVPAQELATRSITSL